MTSSEVSSNDINTPLVLKLTQTSMRYLKIDTCIPYKLTPWLFHQSNILYCYASTWIWLCMIICFNDRTLSPFPVSLLFLQPFSNYLAPHATDWNKVSHGFVEMNLKQTQEFTRLGLQFMSKEFTNSFFGLIYSNYLWVIM